MALDDRGQDFTTLDWIGTLIAATTALGLLVFPIAAQSFATMFREFGSRDLPALTRLALSWWFPVVLALPVIATFGLGLRGSAPIQHRRAWVVVAFVLGCFGIGICLVGVYLPIFSLAGSIKASFVMAPTLARGGIVTPHTSPRPVRTGYWAKFTTEARRHGGKA